MQYKRQPGYACTPEAILSHAGMRAAAGMGDPCGRARDNLPQPCRGMGPYATHVRARPAWHGGNVHMALGGWKRRCNCKGQVCDGKSHAEHGRPVACR